MELQSFWDFRMVYRKNVEKIMRKMDENIRFLGKYKTVSHKQEKYLNICNFLIYFPVIIRKEN